MAYRFKKTETLPRAVRRVFAEEITWAVGQLADPKKKKEGVHEARKSIKKIRALLALLRGPLGGLYKIEDRYFRKTARHLADLRDNDVMLEIFTALAAKHPEIDSLAIRHNLMRDALPAKDASAQVIRLLNEARPTANLWPLHYLDFSTVLPDLKATYRAGRKALKRAEKTDSPAALHDFRKTVKQHWYHVRLFSAASHGPLRELETLLGEHHNLSVLRGRIDAGVETARDRRHARQFIEIIDAETRHLSKRALEAGRRFYADKEMPAISALTPKPPATAAAQRAHSAVA